MELLLLCTNVINYAQEVDSKLGQLIYSLQRVISIKFIQNEQISIRNTGEIHKNSENNKNKHLFNRLVEMKEFSH